jgi:hypothetical protein
MEEDHMKEIQNRQKLPLQDPETGRASAVRVLQQENLLTEANRAVPVKVQDLRRMELIPEAAEQCDKDSF